MADASDNLVAPQSEGAPAIPPGSLLGDLVYLYLRPGKLFSELAQCNRFVGALALLLLFQAAYGWALVQTGVIDLEIDQSIQKQISYQRLHFESDEEGNDKLTTVLDSIDKQAEFRRQMARVTAIAGGPFFLLMRLALLAAILYLTVAFRGGKPKYPILMGVVTFASWVEAPRLLMRLVLIAQLHYTRVETSAAAFVASPKVGLAGYLFLRQLDPYLMWFWILVGLGLCVTGHLTRRAAIITTCLVAFGAVLINAAFDIPELAEITMTMGKN